MSTINAAFQAPITADNAKAVGAHVAVIPAAGTAQVINPVDGHNSVVMLNVAGGNYVRATITFTAGVSGDATAAQQVVLVPPGGVVALDFSNNPNAVQGELRIIDSISLVSVALPAATSEVSALVALTALASATVVLNFAHAG